MRYWLSLGFKTDTARDDNLILDDIKDFGEPGIFKSCF